MLQYDLPPALQTSIKALLEHAQTALWPERRTALDSVRRGIERCEESERRKALDLMGVSLPESSDSAETLFRILVTAYLRHLGETDINNPDQAYLFGLSLDREHNAATRLWLQRFPEFAAD